MHVSTEKRILYTPAADTGPICVEWDDSGRVTIFAVSSPTLECRNVGLVIMSCASCLFGSNFSPVSLGSNLSSPCFATVDIRIRSVILRPSCRFFRSSAPSCFSLSSGTVVSARSRLSTLSIKSLANLVIAKSRAAWMSRFVRSCRLRKSATERRYLSYEKILVS